MAVVPLVELTDPISPALIEHRVDAGLNEETRELLYHYNYLSYRFDVGDSRISARSYLNDIWKTGLQLPEGMDLKAA